MEFILEKTLIIGKKKLIHRIQTAVSGVRKTAFFTGRMLYRSIPLPVHFKKELKEYFWQFYYRVFGWFDPYQRWIRKYDTVSEMDRIKIRQKISQMSRRPAISIVMPVWNTPGRYLKEALDSVLNQLYPNWELCIADDCSADASVRKILDEYASLDARIKVCFRTHNGHISEASNSALELATGDFIALMDHDDVLSEHALYWVAEEILKFPDVELIYSDEDFIRDGIRVSPYFKPDWNPDLLLSQNCVTHLGVYRAERVRRIGGFRKRYDGAQDWDLVLRFTKDLDPGKIRHIPWILYHWRMHPDSTASNLDAKPYAWDAGNNAIMDYLQMCHIRAIVEEAEIVHHRVRYAVSAPAPLVSVVILSTGPLDQLKKCIFSLVAKTSYEKFEILVLHKNKIESYEIESLLGKEINSKIIKINCDSSLTSNVDYDIAVSRAQGKIVFFLHDDVTVIDGQWMEEMVSHSLRHEIGVVGAKLLYPDGKVQHAGIIIGSAEESAHFQIPGENSGYASRASLIQNFSAVSGACMAFQKSRWIEAKESEGHDSLPKSDVDFCLRLLMRGYRNLWTPYALLCHEESESDGQNTFSGRKRLSSEIKDIRKKWERFFANDPAYNPNLSLDYGDFRIASPPRITMPWTGS